MYSATPTLQSPLPLEIPLIVIHILQQHLLIEILPQPIHKPRRSSQLLLELFRHGFGVHVEVFAEELADVCVLMVTDERMGMLGVGGVDVYVGGCGVDQF